MRNGRGEGEGGEIQERREGKRKETEEGGRGCPDHGSHYAGKDETHNLFVG